MRSLMDRRVVSGCSRRARKSRRRTVGSMTNSMYCFHFRYMDYRTSPRERGSASKADLRALAGGKLITLSEVVGDLFLAAFAHYALDHGRSLHTRRRTTWLVQL